MLNLMNIGAACQFRLKDKIAAPREQTDALESLEASSTGDSNGERSFIDSEIQSKLHRLH